jgi:hypothetical protein
MGMMCCVEDGIEFPFEAEVIGEKVIVKALKSKYDLMAVCERKGKTFEINIDSIKFLEPLPDGYEWIEAYQYFREEIG